ncbi:hypothetical protein AU252_01050 [Pseudarthrobacter sulfonivorans]|uniref:Acyl-CoA transferase n=1 Tax=Pseudarthrobacter sulfonivorans TaxID=121292 RepID=A0A0U3R3W9_9MICC|nr:CoA transferase [Pseudarthrobacter sulfonivorans]ALV39921.1 hypothetical protein AU252_01050 [Pseudarthrobacter sulfonivorans]
MSGLTLLDGVKVVSLEQFIAGPHCTAILRDAGAEVIKVERPRSGDPRRAYQPRMGPADDYVSGGFASYNRGKRSVELDLADAEDVAALMVLLAEADVFVCNSRPGSLARLGLGADVLRAKFPQLIVCEISGFGVSGGPYGDWPAFDSVIQAMSGLSSLIGQTADSPPGLAPMGTFDLLSGVYAALGILAALVQRARTGLGSHVDAAMYDIAASFLERPLTLHEFTGEVPTRGIDLFSPVGAFVAGDGGWISIVIPTDEMWARCCSAMGRPELQSAPELDSVLKRANRMNDMVVPALEAWAAGLTTEQAVAKLRDAGQPAGAVQTIEDVRNCPQLAHRGLFTPVQDERLKRADGTYLRLPRLPLLFDGDGAELGSVPRLGGDNDLLSTIRNG